MPTGDKRKKRNESVRKGKKTNNSSSVNRGQMLSDKLARQVGKGKYTYAEAKKIQKAQDDKVSKITHVAKTVRSSSQGLPSKRKYTKAKFKIDRHGNKKAY